MLLGLLQADRLKQLRGFLVVGKFLRQGSQQRDALFETSTVQKLSGLGHSLLPALFGLTPTDGLEQSRDFLVFRKFFLQSPQESSALFKGPGG